MANEARPLEQGYSYEVDVASEHSWGVFLRSFADGNIYQTWQYAAVLNGARNLSHVILKQDGEIVALAIARIKALPFINAGIAYVYHGPVFQRSGSGVNSTHFRHALRALRNEFVCRRGLALRVFPAIFEEDDPTFATILAEEGFSLAAHEARERTIIMDLTPSLGELHQGLGRNWRRNLKQAELLELEISEGTDASMADEFVRIYAQMVSRKDFHASGTVQVFKRLQGSLPDELKMKILMCKYNGEVSAMLATSAIGELGIDMYAATSDAGMQNRASYLLRWKKIQILKDLGVSQYDLNGINPAANPGSYRFKKDLAGKHGREVCYLGKFDASPGGIHAWTLAAAIWLRNTGKRLMRTALKRKRSKTGLTGQSVQGLESDVH
jgi:hypothetical protein